MQGIQVSFIGWCAILLAGCVGSGTHKQTLAELGEARKVAARTAAEFDGYKKQAAEEAEALKTKAAQDLAALHEETSRLAGDLRAAQVSSVKAQEALETVAKDLVSEQEGRQEIEGRLKKLQDKVEKFQQALAEANVRLAASAKEKEQVTAALAEARDQSKELTTKLATEQVKVSILREDKQRLLSGTTTAQEEIARLQKQAGLLDAERARAEDLAKRLSEREQEVGKLRQTLADREALAAKLAVLQQDREQLASRFQQQQERLKAAEEDKARLAQERAAKEAEVQRLSKTQADLATSLEAEIAKGDIRIKQVRDRLTINVVDRVLFDSGQGQVKTSGLKVLKQVADIIQTVTDKQVRIEGHTDNVPIGGKLREKFPTNWELSTARATSVVRYLIEEGGLDRSLLSAVGYADTKPVAGNSTEEGRKANRRIEITLYPKDLSEIANQIKP